MAKRSITLKMEELEIQAIEALAKKEGYGKTAYIRQILRDKAHAEMLKGKSYVQALNKIIKGE